MRHEAGEALGAIGTPACLQQLQLHERDACQEVASLALVSWDGWPLPLEPSSLLTHPPTPPPPCGRGSLGKPRMLASRMDGLFLAIQELSKLPQVEPAASAFR